MRTLLRECSGLIAVVFLGCTSVVQSAAAVDDPEVKIQKLTTDNRILEKALKRCKEQLPPEYSWPWLYSIGSFGNVWISSDSHGRVFDLKPHFGDHEEQVFIVSRSDRSQKVKAEGVGIRQVDSDTINAIFVYVPPTDDEERRKMQKIIITVEDYRFVILFKPSRY